MNFYVFIHERCPRAESLAISPHRIKSRRLTHRAHHASLRQTCGQYAGEISHLVLRKSDGEKVWARLVLRLVHTDKNRIRIKVRGAQRFVPQANSARDDHIESVLCEVCNVLLVVTGVNRFNMSDLIDTSIFL